MKDSFLNNSGTLVVNLLLHEFFADKIELGFMLYLSNKPRLLYSVTGNAGKGIKSKSLQFSRGFEHSVTSFRHLIQGKQSRTSNSILLAMTFKILNP